MSAVGGIILFPVDETRALVIFQEREEFLLHPFIIKIKLDVAIGFDGKMLAI